MGPMCAAERQLVTEDEYLALERASEVKHEYINGEMIAMAGATYRHNVIASNIHGMLWSRLRGKPCRALQSDQRVGITETGAYTYPDVSVVCGGPEFHPKDDWVVCNPTILVEVLSKSTAEYDRTAKFAHYRHLPSLREYLLVEQKERRVQHYRRIESGEWLFTEYTEGDVKLPTLELTLPVDEIYDGVDELPLEG